MITREKIRNTVLKHLAGQHNQKRHGWRYGQPKVERGPLFTDADERSVFEQRAITRHGIAEQDVAYAKKTISIAQDKYLNDMQGERMSMSQIKYNMALYREEKEIYNAMWEKWQHIGKPLEEKQKAKGDLKRELEKELESIELSKGRSSPKYIALRKKIIKLDQQYWEINDKLWSGKLKDFQEKMYDQKKRWETMALRATDDLRQHWRYSEEGAAASRYITATSDARNTLMKYYRGQAEQLRKQAVSENKRNLRWKEYYTEKYKKAGEEYYAEMEKYQAGFSGGYHTSFEKTPLGSSLWNKRMNYSNKADSFERKANQVLGGKLEQKNRTEMNNISTGKVDKNSVEAVEEGLDLFSRYAGTNKLFSNDKHYFITSGERYARAGFLNGVVTTSKVPKENMLKDYRKSVTPHDVKQATQSVHHEVLHELGHGLEHSDPGIRHAAYSFWKRRTAGETPTALYGDLKFGDIDFTEYSLKDKFVDAYMGKTYGKEGVLGGENMFTTEVISTGIAMFYESPMKLALNDPDMFGFIYSVLRMNE